MGLNTPWFLRPAVARLAALVLAVALALPGAASGLAAPADQALVCPPGGPSAGEAPRRLAFELDFGAGSPYAQRYGEQFRALDYARRAAVTAEVLDYIVDVALRLAGATTLARGYGPGGY